MENLDIYEVKLPKKRGGKEFYKIELKEIDEETYIMASSLVKAGKDVEATKMVLKGLHVGGDVIDEVLNNFIAVQAGMTVVLDLITPMEVELKKKSNVTK